MVQQERGWSEEEIAFIINLKENTALTWVELTEKFNKKFKSDRHHEAIKKCYQRNKDYFASNDNYVKTLKQVHRSRKTNSVVSRENKAILDYLNNKEDILDCIKNAVKAVAVKKYSIPKTSKHKDKIGMTLELLFSDVHYGKLIRPNQNRPYPVDIKEIRSRVRKMSDIVIKEIEKESKNYNVERLIIASLGDLIESAHFHGVESNKASEFGTSRQVQECIESFFYDLLLPLALTGIQIDVEAITGNHDRLSEHKTHQYPGEDNLTYIIYNTLSLLCKQSNINNVKFNIVDGLYSWADIYGNIVVYEHGDELKNINKDTIIGQMNRRQRQIGKVVNFFRFGHWHEPVMYGQGTAIGNGSVPGQDSYADDKGFISEAVQILNYYVDTKNRNTKFYRSFPIYLERK